MNDEQKACPDISIVIPTQNRKNVLQCVLNGLTRQTCDPSLFEIIVVDDGSDDGTQTVVKNVSKTSKSKIKYIHQAKLGPGAARNSGISQARGKWILFLDTDLIPETDVVERHRKFHQEWEDEYTCLMGDVEMASGLNIPQQARKNETNIHLNGSGLQELNHWNFRTGNASLAKSLCAAPSGFDPRYEAAEDTEFGYRLHAMGVKFYYDGSIKVYHHHPMNMDECVEKYAAYGRAVALWYLESPEARRELALRYGVYAAELSLVCKGKHFIRALLVNRWTIASLSWMARHIKSDFLLFSNFLKKNLVQYYCRKAFRTRLFSLIQMRSRREISTNILRQVVT
jgi:glycosyltransferase involved in cell wall biosynthesis